MEVACSKLPDLWSILLIDQEMLENGPHAGRILLEING